MSGWAAAAQFASDIVGQRMANTANQKENRLNREWQSVEAEKGRSFEREEAATARDFSRLEATRTRNWEEEMSNTAVTRRMMDLKNAGINPILAGKYDATTPPGAMAQSAKASNASPSGGSAARYENEISPAVSTAISFMSTKADIKLKDAMVALRQVETRLKENFEPTTEIMKNISSELLEMVEAARELMTYGKKEYKEFLMEIRSKAIEALERYTGGNTPITPEAKRSLSDMIEDTGNWLKSKWKKFQSLDRRRH